MARNNWPMRALSSPPLTAVRAASTAMEVVSSSYPATERVPLPPPDPRVAAMSARARRWYGTYAP